MQTQCSPLRRGHSSHWKYDPGSTFINRLYKPEAARIKCSMQLDVGISISWWMAVNYRLKVKLVYWGSYVINLSLPRMGMRHGRPRHLSPKSTKSNIMMLSVAVSLQRNIMIKKNSVRAECLLWSRRGPSEPSETSKWQLTPCEALLPHITLHIALPLRFTHLFSLTQCPVLNQYSSIVANWNHMSEWVHWVRACIGIAIGWVTPRKPLLVFLLPACKMQFSLYKLYTSLQVARSSWLFTIHHSFYTSPVLLLLAISGITYMQPMMFPTLITCRAPAAVAFLTCTNFKMGSKWPEFAGVAVSARAN